MRLLIAGLLSALFVLVGSPVNKQVEHAASVNVTTAVAKPSAPQQGAQPQPEKEAAKVEETKPEPPAVAPQETVKPPEPAPQPLTDHEQLMQAAGIQPSDWPAVEFIVSNESSWRPNVRNSEGCVGLGQRCPASVLYAACPDLDPVCQLRHFSNYAPTRYGGWQSAYNAWVSQRWW